MTARAALRPFCSPHAMTRTPPTASSRYTDMPSGRPVQGSGLPTPTSSRATDSLQELCKAARRGVSVTLVLQGMPDLKSVRVRSNAALRPPAARGCGGARILPEALARQGRDHRRGMEYRGVQQPRSIEPCAQHEANVFVESEAFNRQVATRLQAMSAQCLRIRPGLFDCGAAGRCSAASSFFTFCDGHRASAPGFREECRKFKTPRSAEST